MNIETDDYRVEHKPNDSTSKFSGILRLASPKEYERLFTPLMDSLKEKKAPVTVDMSEVKFLNSSGIAALGRMIITARQNKSSLTFQGKKDIIWQERTFNSLKKLWPKLTIKLL